MEKIGLKNYNIGEIFIGFCIIRKKELKHKQNGEPYLILELGDKSGRLRSKIWREAKEYYENLKVGQLLKIKGKIQSFLDTKELNVERLRLARKDEISIEEIVPISKKDVQFFKEQFQEHIEKIKNPYLNELLNHIFPDISAWDIYLKTPSGKLWHHNYLYGILEHIVCLLDLSDVMVKHYPIIQIDLLKTAIILHNLGKKIEYGYNGFIDYTTEGRLIGHIVLGYQMVDEKIAEIDDFPDELRLQLLHLILSHQGSKENDAPVVPMTLEAMVLHLMNELDVQANAFLRIIENDRLPDNSKWTRYNNLLNRFIYIGNEPEHNKDDEQNEKMDLKQKDN